MSEVKVLFDGRIREALIGRYLDPRALFAILYQTIRDHAAKFKAEGLEQVIVYVENLFDEYVRPFDIPGVPNVVEPAVDDMLRGTIRPILTDLFERFVEEE